MTSRKKRNLTLLDILISLPTDPRGMMQHLLIERERPPYLFLSPIALLLVLVAPAMYQRHLLETAPPDMALIYSTSLTCVLTLIAFVLFMSVLMRILAIKASVGSVFATTIYSLLGLVPVMCAFYLVNFSVAGELSILTFLCTGQYRVEDWSIPLFHIAVKVGAAFCFWLFLNGVKALGKTSFLSAFSTTLVALPVLAGSFAAALTVANNTFPETGATVQRFFVSLFTSVAN